ncbi:HNH endonuclease [Pseudomonas proteolytica]|uniref:HNH endonuclease signature motif containing protein n=1 Tax=Pseudomonas proteolytica TaxID=219574 RepID=UPI001473CF60|nr:HNH endonuclease [Pseudomonas proteolytica]
MVSFFAKRRFNEDDLKSLNSFILSKNKSWDVVKGNLTRIARLYARYHIAVAFPYKHKAKPQLSGACAKVMHDLYERRVVSLSYIADLRKWAKEALGCCPYCGIPGTMTLDHYLPKALKAFPEYAVLSENLVPACGECQSAKGERYSKRLHTCLVIRRREPTVTARKKRSLASVAQSSISRPVLRVWHPYLDSFLDSTVLAIATKPDGDYRVFALGYLDKWRRRCVEHHVHVLGMGARAGHFIRRTKESFARSLREEGVRTEEGIRVRLPALLKGAQGEAKDNENAIKVAYVRALRTDGELLKDLLNEMSRPPQSNKEVSASYRKAPVKGRRRRP